MPFTARRSWHWWLSRRENNGKNHGKPCKAMVKTTGGSFGNPSDGKIEQILYENFLGN